MHSNPSPFPLPFEGRGLRRGETRSVGRIGELVLEYSRQGGETILANSHCQSPWHLFPPFTLDDTGCAYTLLLNPSGGLVGGDHLSVRVTLDPEAHVLISTPSANKVYRSLADVSIQDAEITIGAGANLEWVPEPTIPFAGSRYRQALHVSLAPGATVLLWDAIASGRIARKERWAFSSLENEIRITTASGESLLERYELAPVGEWGRIGLAEEWDYVASLFVVGDGIKGDVWTNLETRLATVLDERPGRVLGGVSQPVVPGLAVKLLAHAAPDLTTVLEGLWGAVRSELWGLAPVVWRKY